MIRKKNRFHGHNSLNPVYKRGQTVNISQMSLKSISARSGHDYRLAVVVSKKVDKSAVARNRIRRRIYELVRVRAADLAQPTDIVINVYNAQTSIMKSQELSKIIDDLLSKAGLLTSASGNDHAIVDKQKEQA
jgi:ribonuclease P protein component